MALTYDNGVAIAGLLECGDHVMEEHTDARDRHRIAAPGLART